MKKKNNFLLSKIMKIYSQVSAIIVLGFLFIYILELFISFDDAGLIGLAMIFLFFVPLFYFALGDGRNVFFRTWAKLSSVLFVLLLVLSFNIGSFIYVLSRGFNPWIFGASCLLIIFPLYYFGWADIRYK